MRQLFHLVINQTLITAPLLIIPYITDTPIFTADTSSWLDSSEFSRWNQSLRTMLPVSNAGPAWTKLCESQLQYSSLKSLTFT